MAKAPALFELNNFGHSDTHRYYARCPIAMPGGDTMMSPRQSRLLLLEEGVPLGPSHRLHSDISARGLGSYSHWGETLFFSTSDNTDPRTNGRTYVGVWLPASASTSVTHAQTIISALPDQYTQSQAYSAIEEALKVLVPKAWIGEDCKLFWESDDLIAEYRRLCGANSRSFERKLVVYNLVRSLGHIEGDLAECGVFEGATSAFMAKGDAAAGRKRVLHLFDSFEGLSNPQQQDGDHWTKGDLSASETIVRANLAGFEQVRMYRGWIPSRFSDVENCVFAFVHLDVDLYQPTLASLEFFYERMSPNGIIVCDDSGFATCPGATLAMIDYFSDKPERIIDLPTGQGIVIKRSTPIALPKSQL